MTGHEHKWVYYTKPLGDLKTYCRRGYEWWLQCDICGEYSVDKNLIPKAIRRERGINDDTNQQLSDTHHTIEGDTSIE